MRRLPVVTLLTLSVPSLAWAVNDACDAYGALVGIEGATDGDATVIGEHTADFFGTDAHLLDYDGDGIPDLAVGAPGVDDAGPRAGAVYVFLGPIDELSALDPATADATLTGSGFNEGAGLRIAVVPDLDADGADELLVGSLPGLGASHRAGVAYLVSGGGLGTLDLDVDAQARFFGAATGDEFGSVVASAGDADGDGFGDLAIGAPKADGLATRGGEVHVFSGPFSGDYHATTDASWVLASDQDDASFGMALLAVPDLDGDGADELVVGSPRDGTRGMRAGAAYLFTGQTLPVTGTLGPTDARASWLGFRSGQRLGASLADGGPLGTWGLAHLWIGAPQAGRDNRGAAYAVTVDAWGTSVPARDAWLRILGDEAGALFGGSISGATDVDADGEVDVAIGASRASTALLGRTGAVLLFHGPLQGGVLSASDAALRVHGEAELDLFGMAVASGEDVNGDGFDDLVAGAWRDASSGSRKGLVTVFLGGEDLVDEVTWYEDADLDGWGDDTSTLAACTQPAGYVQYGGDCNDTSTAYHPGATEPCSGPDFNCDGYFGSTDNDGDGFMACLDCDDGDASVKPGATESCDDVDNDCNGLVDDVSESNGGVMYLVDGDGDGFGGGLDDNPGNAVACSLPPELQGEDVVNVGGDCDDADVEVFPGALELCDGIDNDCDDQIDESGGAGAPVWYRDADLDGAGDRWNTVIACEQPDGYVATSGDCHDANASILPGQAELCDALDNDCDGATYLGGPVEGSEAWVALAGEAADAAFGERVALVPDIDGDGLAELIVASPRAGSAEQGRVTLFFGHGAGHHDQGAGVDVMSEPASVWTVTGHLSGGRLGSSIATGDLDGDGETDLVVGAPLAFSGAALAGRVMVFYGPLRPGLEVGTRLADWTLTGAAGGERFGTSVAVEDLDGDGVDDLVVGATGASATASLDEEGSASIFHGSTTRRVGLLSRASADAELFGDAAGAGAGSALTVFDLDGSGDPALVVGMADRDGPSGLRDGGVLIWWGSATQASGTLTEDVSLYGDGTLMSLGRSLAHGDIDGDGADDLLVGSLTAGAWVFAGGPSLAPSGLALDAGSEALWNFTGEDGAGVGREVASAGDLDGDGADDLLLGATGLVADPQSGEGPFEGGVAVVLYGGQDFSSFSSDDLTVEVDVVESRGRRLAGEAFPTWSASSLGVPEGAWLVGDARTAGMGQAISGGHDIDGDGRPDVAVGAPDALEAGSGDVVGQAWVFLGGPYGLDDDVPQGGLTAWIWDADLDGWSDEGLNGFDACEFHVPVSFANPSAPQALALDDLELAQDCDDTDAQVYPGAVEIDGDGVDRDCDGYDDVNNLPTAVVTIVRAPDAPTHLPAGDTRLDTTADLLAEVVATDPDGDPVTATFEWRVDAGLIAGENSDTLGSEHTQRDDVVSVRVTLDDTRDTVVLPDVSVTIVNAPPSLDACATSPDAAYVNTALQASYTGLADSDPLDATLLEVRYQWEIDTGTGFFPITGQTGATLASCLTRGTTCSVGDALRLACTPYDGTEEGVSRYSEGVEILNSAPTVNTCTISPVGASTALNLTAAATGTDLNGDSLTWSWVWVVNGVEDTSVTSSVYPSGNTSHFDVIQVRCTATDTHGAVSQEVTSAPLTIVNTVPTTPSVSITPASPTSAEDFQAVVTQAAVDVDGDSITYTYTWLQDGQTFPTPSDQSLMQAFVSERGEEWTVEVRAYDGYGYSEPATATVTIGNSLPSITSASLGPANPDTTDDITVTVAGWYDEDGDPQWVEVDWYIDGVLQSALSGAGKTTLEASATSKGDLITADVRPIDTYGSGAQVSAGSLTIQNAPPVAPEIELTPNPPDEDDALVCDIVVDADDADGDTLTYVYTFVSDTQGSVQISGGLSDTLPSSYTSYAEVWYCTVSVSDSSGAVAPLATSQTVAVQDESEPSAPVVSPPTRYTNDEVITVTGTCVTGDNDCHQVVVTCEDFTGTDSDTVDCDTGGVFEAEMTLVRGAETSCSAYCRDIALNESLDSNIVLVESCDPEDLYEDDAGYGDSSGLAITDEDLGSGNALSLLLDDDNAESFSLVGNIISGDVVDWFVIDATNTAVQGLTDGVATTNPFHFEIEMVEGVGDYAFTVWRDDPIGLEECPALAPYDEYSFFAEDVGDAPNHSVPANTQTCANNSGLYNDCEDLGASVWVKVERLLGQDCQHYDLRVYNGRAL